MEGFFYITCGADEEERIIDRFASRYGWTIDEILDLGAGDLYRMYRQIRIEERRTQAREQWLVMLPMMLKKEMRFISYEDYWDRVSGQSIDTRPAEEILAEVEEIRSELEKEGG